MAKYPNTPTHDNSTKFCLEDWESDLKGISNKLQMTLQEKQGHTAKHTNAMAWESKLSTFWQCIQVTDNLTQEIAGQLELFLGQTKLVCKNIDCSKTAISFLYCRVKKIFICTDKLKEKLLDFFMKLDCLGDDTININSSFIVQCVTNISAKLDQAIVKQQELLKKMIDILKCINEIEKAICEDDCSVEGRIYHLMDVFKRSEEEGITCDITKSCDEEIAPKPILPLNCEKVYVFTQEQHRLAEIEKKEVKRKLEEVCKEYESLASCERSLKDAIDCSKTVQECK